MPIHKARTKKGKRAAIKAVMHEYKAGNLHSGKGGPLVKDPVQATAIAMRMAGMPMKSGKKKMMHKPDEMNRMMVPKGETGAPRRRRKRTKSTRS